MTKIQLLKKANIIMLYVFINYLIPLFNKDVITIQKDDIVMFFFCFILWKM